MQMNMNVTFGDVLQIAATIVAIFIGYMRIRERLAVLETKVDAMWDRRQRPRGHGGDQ